MAPAADAPDMLNEGVWCWVPIERVADRENLLRDGESAVEASFGWLSVRTLPEAWAPQKGKDTRDLWSRHNEATGSSPVSEDGFGWRGVFKFVRESDFIDKSFLNDV